jgi:hypothetical protein
MSIKVLEIVHDTGYTPSRNTQCPMQSPMPAAHMLNPAMWMLFLYEDVLSTSIGKLSNSQTHPELHDSSFFNLARWKLLD